MTDRSLSQIPTCTNGERIVHVTTTQSSTQLCTSDVHVPPAPTSDNAKHTPPAKYTPPTARIPEKPPMPTSMPACTLTRVDHHSDDHTLQPPNQHKTQNKISIKVDSGNDSESPISSSDEMHTSHLNKTCTNTSSCTDCNNHLPKHKYKQISPKSWEQLSPSLQALLPKIDNVTYVVESYQEEDRLSFEGAPKFSYHLEVRINLENEEQAKKFLKQMMEHSYCTYRITRTSKKPAMKRVAYKIEMHCQHFRKGLSKKDKDKSALSQSKKAQKPFTVHVRNKKTQCPSRLTLTGKVPTKKQLAATNKAYLKSHKPG